MSELKGSEKVKRIRSYTDLPQVPRADVVTDTVAFPSWRAQKPVIHTDKCTKCYVCWKFCPDVAIAIDDEGWPVIHLAFCKGCGICAYECAPEAIDMVRED